MSQVIWLKRAVRSLDSILAFIAKDNPVASQRLVVEIRNQVELLASHPHLGRAGRVLGTRELVVHEHYIVPYRVSKGRVEILTVQHAKRHWPKRNTL